ncbi:Transcription initiation factor TFIID subunit 9 [Xanthoria parietina]
MADTNDAAAARDPNSSVSAQAPSRNDSQHQANPNKTNASVSTDDGLGRRPRDSRLLHTVLANLGVTSYQERVPLQLMDFAYRFTSSTLQDALHLTSEGYGAQTFGTGKAANNELSAVSLSSLRLSIESRTHYQFNPTLSKEFYHEIAQERNQVQLPSVGKDLGLRLPPEQYCLTGVGWKLKDEWNVEDQGDGADDDVLDQSMMDPGVDQDEDEAEGGNDRMEDIFGEDVNGNDGDQGMDDG